ncbi:MAG TPA: adenosylcobinamide-GDP ribazoletransferase [Thermaerobacter sp.]
MVALLVALQFLTVLPPPARRPVTAEDLGRAVGWFPLVGALLGAVLAGGAVVLAGRLHGGVGAALLLALWAVLTGGLHLDGLLDTCDGLFGGRTPAERLRIMRDEQVGAFAVIGGGLLLITKHAALSSLPDPAVALFLAPVVARWAMALAIVMFPYARGEGLGRAMKDHARPRDAWLATALAAAAVALAGLVAFGGPKAVLGATVTGLAAGGVLVWVVLRRLPGLTGDVYGALAEVVETAVLVGFCL